MKICGSVRSIIRKMERQNWSWISDYHRKRKKNNIQGKIKVSLQDIYSDENHVLLDETENLNNPVIQKNLPVEGSVNNEIQFRYELEESVHAWSNEDPYLYELLIEVQNEKRRDSRSGSISDWIP